MSDDDLMTLFSAMTRWTDYAAGQLALAEIEHRRIESLLTVKSATVLISGWTGDKEDKVTIQRAERDADPEVREIREELDVAYATKKLMQVMFDSLDRDASLLSRELTRRIGRRESNERRADRWSAK